MAETVFSKPLDGEVASLNDAITKEDYTLTEESGVSGFTYSFFKNVNEYVIQIDHFNLSVTANTWHPVASLPSSFTVPTGAYLQASAVVCDGDGNPKGYGRIGYNSTTRKIQIKSSVTQTNAYITGINIVFNK